MFYLDSGRRRDDINDNSLSCSVASLQMTNAFPRYKAGYTALWESMYIVPGREAEVNKAAALVLQGKSRYLAVERETGVPWFVVGILHHMEADCNFDCWLHNGDPMHHDGVPARTIHVPKGRPPDPAVSWEVGAKDALHIDGLDKVNEWSVERLAYEVEAYNGFGYRYHGVNSPYLWSCTNHYTKGRYVADGIFDPDAVSHQCGAMAILARLMALDPTIAIELAATKKPVPAPLPEPPKPSPEPGPRAPAPPNWLAWLIKLIGDLLAGWKGKK